jgi:hypothetical protein
LEAGAYFLKSAMPRLAHEIIDSEMLQQGARLFLGSVHFDKLTD